MVFALATDDGGLIAFPSAVEAASHCEGIDVEDGVWAFFSEDGSPLKPIFQTPNKRGRFMVTSGTYTLQPTVGPRLHERLAEINGVEGCGISSVAELRSHLRQRGVSGV